MLTRLPRLFALLLVLLAVTAMACTPSRRGGRGSNGSGGGNNGDDDDAADDTGDDDDAADTTLFMGSASGSWSLEETSSGQCAGKATVRVSDSSGEVTEGRVDCGFEGSVCTFTFSGVYAFSEEAFEPSFDCEIDGASVFPDVINAYIWGSEGSYVSGSIDAGDSFSGSNLSLYFDTYGEDAM